MTRATVMRPRVGGGDTGSVFTARRPLLNVAGGADPHDRMADLDAEPDEEDNAIRRGIHELLCRCDTKDTTVDGGIPITG
jgi:hypothetical protein